jgi:sodium-dependent dicarboxylate transporter 2/3/5
MLQHLASIISRCIERLHSSLLKVVRQHGRGYGGLCLAFALLALILCLPSPHGLSAQGQAALAVVACSLLLWTTEAVSVEVSTILIVGLIAVVMGLTPATTSANGAPLGTTRALALALSGFSSPMVALLVGSLFIATAMMMTGLDRRLAFFILARVSSESMVYSAESSSSAPS